MRAVRIHQGTYRKVSALAMKNDVPIYQEELFPQFDDVQRGRIAFHVEFLCERQFPVHNTTICKQLKSCHRLYELRIGQTRLLFFMIHNDIVITHGFIKKKNTTDKSEIKRAESLRTKFLRGES